MRQMRDHALEAISLTSGMSPEDLANNRVVALAVTRLVEIVGEAATRVSPQVQATHREIPWRDAIDTRHRVAHGYDTVDMHVIWMIVHHEFPPLAQALEQALSQYIRDEY
jgi:uncharacterized protein with HEPN domain